MNGFVIHSVVFVVTLCLMSITSAHANVVELWGDQNINDTQTWSGNHYKIHGNLMIGPSGELAIEDSTIEMMCTYDREFSIVVEGTLRTTNCVIGGTGKLPTVIHCNIEIQGGWWYATDTTVQYTYGLTFHRDKPSYLRATRLKAGIRSDAILIGGRADVIVRDSIYPIVVVFDASAGGTTTLEFPANTPITMVYDKHNCPGANYRMELINTTVTMWFLWLSNVSSDGPIATYNLRNCPSFIISMSGHNLRGSASLPACYDVESNQWNRYLPANTHISFGSVRINTLNDRVNLTCWALYLGGNSTDFTITGSTNIAELQTRRGAVCRVFGEPGTHNACLPCTTLDAFHDSKILVRNATLGGLGNMGNTGQISAHDSSSIVFEDCVVGYTMLIPRDGDIEFINCIKYKSDVEITELSGGGQISWSYTPTAHYEFESDALDSVGNNHGTVYGASLVPGQVGSLAAHFDGIDDYIEIPCVIQDDFTIAFWVRTASTAVTGSWPAGNGLVDGMDVHSSEDFGTALIGGKFGFGVGRALGRENFITITSSTDINDDQWHHVAATRDARTGEMKVYVDGVEEASAVGPTGTKDAASIIRVGCLGPGINFFEGDIDDLRLYNYVLGDTELAYLTPYGLSEVLDTTLSLVTGGNAEWFCQTETSYYDGDAAQSGNILDDQESWMQMTVSGPTTADFYWKVSSETGCDILEFYIDDVRQDQISGSVDWKHKSYTIPSGSHRLKWQYVKDSSVSSGSDCGLVDKVTLGLSSPPTP